MRMPATYVVFRLATIALTVAVLLLAGLGLSSHGPLSSLGALTDHVISWVYRSTGVRLP